MIWIIWQQKMLWIAKFLRNECSKSYTSCGQNIPHLLKIELGATFYIQQYRYVFEQHHDLVQIFINHGGDTSSIDLSLSSETQGFSDDQIEPIKLCYNYYDKEYVPEDDISDEDAYYC